MNDELSIGEIKEGIVLDHIKAGNAMTIYRDLKLGKLDCTVAIIKNARSGKMGRKDIIKVECPIDYLDLDVLGFIDHDITVNIVKDRKIIEKKTLRLPKQIVNVIACKNPRCITSIEQGLDQVFVLTDEKNEIYRCKYCEEKYTGRK
ncbi:MAG: aspartate carbamoyltransferase regulatory subunit [Lachnospiraceae bacterium]|nr:aspartate carbamoyltransferase regulatory subunit [Lachnospiraceae bacterium]